MNDIPRHDELTLADYDHIPSGTSASRLSGLDEAGVGLLVEYERAHGNRLPANPSQQPR